MIMRRRAVTEGPKAAQKVKLLLTKARDVGEAFRPRQHRHQRKKQNLIQRINHLPRLPVIRYLFEITKKNRRLNRSSQSRTRIPHRKPPC